MTDRELIAKLRLLEKDHAPEDCPAVPMGDISRLLGIIDAMGVATPNVLRSIAERLSASADLIEQGLSGPPVEPEIKLSARDQEVLARLPDDWFDVKELRAVAGTDVLIAFCNKGQELLDQGYLQKGRRSDTKKPGVSVVVYKKVPNKG